MSVRYTAAAGMAEAASRQLDQSAERWRDKIELRLDNRQVFFLFFGSAVVACMLFVLGVMVGKRIESRGQAQAPELQDPLAALDRARQPPPGVAAPEAQLTFPNSLLGGGPAAARGVPRAMKEAPKAAVRPPRVLPPQQATKGPSVAARSLASSSGPAIAPRSVAPVLAPRPVAPPVALRPAAPAVGPRPVAQAADAPKAKGRFTLQLSTFATADDAREFANKVPGSFVISAEIPGKGTAYRVRFGNFASYGEATAAKDSFEKQHNLIALVSAR